MHAVRVALFGTTMRGPEGPAAAADACFHEAYDVSRRVAVHAGPILIVVGDELVLQHDGERSVVTFTPSLFHVAKSVAHGPVAILACSYRAVSRVLDDASVARLGALAAALSRVEVSLGRSVPDNTPLAANLGRIITMTLRYLERALIRPRIDADALATFATAVGPALLQCTRHATSLQLQALHSHSTRLLASLDATERRSLEVIVAGAHQARARSLPMQYFGKLLCETPGEERRLTYAEGVQTVDEALALVGTRRLDRQIALALFGSSNRLQRDVLGDAAAELIEQLQILPLR